MTRPRLLGLWGLCCAFVCSAPGRAEEPALPDRASVLRNLRAEHPRLLATEADFEKVQSQCKSDERAKRLLERLDEQATKLLSAPPVQYEIPDGKRLLSVSRRAKDRLLLLGCMYRLTGDRRFADRAWTELEAVVKFKDWNPSHFLDTAEMTFAVAIGYDWLYDAWTDERRAILREAIVRKGLQPGLDVYRKKQWWSKARHNWNQVCNGGMAIGALAIGDAEPELAAEILHSALHSLPLAMREFRPDGGWGEGPGYWRYATEYNVYLLAALGTAVGGDFGLSRMPGFSRTGDFPIQMTGPTGATFNFADAHEGWGGAAQLLWLAGRFERPAYAAAQLVHAEARPTALDLLWGASWLSRGDEEDALPLAARFTGVEVVALRSAWNDPNAVFVAFKGGDNRVNHGHLDLGSFVLDALGQRWALDLGPDDYNLPGYFGRQRWTYFRNNTQSHNTVVIGGDNQSASAQAKIVRFAPRESWMGAVVDLTVAWPQTRRCQRGVALVDRRIVLVQDEIEADKPVETAWQMLTNAQVQIDGASAILSKGGRRLQATLHSPAGARWESVEVRVEPPERPIGNVRKLIAKTAEPQQSVRFVVCFDTAAEGQAEPEIRPLAEWPDESE